MLHSRARLDAACVVHACIALATRPKDVHWAYDHAFSKFWEVQAADRDSAGDADGDIRDADDVTHLNLEDQDSGQSAIPSDPPGLVPYFRHYFRHTDYERDRSQVACR